jgi:hypothetical protein
MGKKEGTGHPTRGDLVEDALRIVHNARDVIANAASELVRAPDLRGLAGRMFVCAELLRIEAIDMRADCTEPDPNIVAAFRGAGLPTPADKPKRVRGPRKPRTAAGNATAHLQPSDEELERLTAPNGAP